MYKTYENEGPEAGLIKLGVNATLFAVGGIAVKGGSVLARKAVAEILARNSGLQLALGSLIETMHISAEKVMATNAGQKVAAGVAKMDAPLMPGYESASKAFDRLRGKSTGQRSVAKDFAPPRIPDAGKTKIHGNSGEYVGENHVYVIRDAEGNIHKVGESMQGINKSGKSIRAETQRRKLERQTGERYETEIREIFSSKGAARDWKTKTIKKYRNFFGDDKLPGNKGNH